MKLGYHYYYLTMNGIKILTDINEFINVFCKINDFTFKNSFIIDSESYYLFKVSERVYLFLVTQSNDIIKAVNRSNVSYKDIYDSLGSDERLGFASYIVMNENYYGCATTIFGPKNIKWAKFINEIFKKMNINYVFHELPFVHSSTRGEIFSMPIVGKTIVEIDKSNTLWGQIKGYFLGEDVEEINSIEIVIKPLRGKSIKKSVENFSSKISDEGVKKYIIKAKNTLSEPLQDYYVTGRGHVADLIKTNTESEIVDQIRKKAGLNKMLNEKVRELQNDARYEKQAPSALVGISNFYDEHNWIRILQASKL